ncbi:MAG: hypothetical protein ACR2PG_15590 [Hyphomicrobiaceae bacterium]
MPICSIGCRSGRGPEQLIRSASLFCLERDLIAEGISRDGLWSDEQDWSRLDKPLARWLDTAAAGVAQAAASAASVIDFDAVVIDGIFPRAVRDEFVEQVRKQYNHLDQQGLAEIEILAGTIGRNAPAIGAACMLILSRYAVDNAALPARSLAI